MREVTSAGFMEGTLDEEGQVLSLNKVEAALSSVNIALRDADTGQFRDLGDVLTEMGTKWKDLDSNTKAYLATTISGQRQQSRFIAAMDNWDDVMKNVEISQNSAGKSSEQYDKKLQSLETSLIKISAAFEKLFTQIIDPEALRKLFDNFAGFISFMGDNKIIAIIGTLSIALLGLMAIGKSYEKNKIEDLALIEREIIVRENERAQITMTSSEIDKEAKRRAALAIELDKGNNIVQRAISLKEVLLSTDLSLNSVMIEQAAELDVLIAKYVGLASSVDNAEMEMDGLEDKLLNDKEAIEQMAKAYEELRKQTSLPLNEDLHKKIKEGSATKEDLDKEKDRLVYGGGLSIDERSALKTKDYMVFAKNRIENGGTGLKLILGEVGILEKYRVNMGNLNKLTGELAKTSVGTGKSMLGLKAQILGVSLGARMSTVAMQMFSTEMIATAIVGAASMAALTAGISLVTMGLSFLWKTISGEQALENLQKKIEGINEEIGLLEEKITKIDELSASYEELTSKENLNAEEKIQLTEVTNELSSAVEGLNLGYDSNGNLIVKNTARIKEYRLEQEKLLKTQNLANNMNKVEEFQKKSKYNLWKRTIDYFNPLNFGNRKYLQSDEEYRQQYSKDNPAEVAELKEIFTAIVSDTMSLKNKDMKPMDEKISRAIAVGGAMKKYSTITASGGEITEGEIQKTVDDALESFDKLQGTQSGRDMLNQYTELEEKMSKHLISVTEFNSQYDILKKKFEENPLIPKDSDLTLLFGSSAGDYLNKFKQEMSSYQEDVSAGYERIAKKKENMTDLQNALSELNTDGELTIETIQKITAGSEELSQYLMETGDLEFRGGEEGIRAQREIGQLIKEQLTDKQRMLIVQKQLQNEEYQKEIDKAKQELPVVRNLMSKEKDPAKTETYRQEVEFLEYQVELKERLIQQNNLEITGTKLLLKELESEYSLSKKSFENNKDKYSEIQSMLETLKETGLTADVANTIATSYSELLPYISNTSLLIQKLKEVQNKANSDMKNSYRDMIFEKLKNDKSYYNANKKVLTSLLTVERLKNLGISESEATAFAARLKSYQTFTEARVEYEKFLTKEFGNELTKQLMMQNTSVEAAEKALQARINLKTAHMGTIGIPPEFLKEEAEAKQQLAMIKAEKDATNKAIEALKTKIEVPDLKIPGNKDKDDSKNEIKSLDIYIAKLNEEIDKLKFDRLYLDIIEDSKEYQENLKKEITLQQAKQDLYKKAKDMALKEAKENSYFATILKEVDDLLKDPKNKLADIKNKIYTGKADTELSQKQKEYLDNYFSAAAGERDAKTEVGKVSFDGLERFFQEMTKRNDVLKESQELLKLNIELYKENSKVGIASVKQLLAVRLEERRNYEKMLKQEEDNLKSNLELTSEQKDAIKKNISEIKKELANFSTEQSNAELLLNSLLGNRSAISANLEHNKNLIGDANTVPELNKNAEIIMNMMDQKKKSVADVSNYIEKNLIPKMLSSDSAERDTAFTTYQTMNESMKTMLEEYVSLSDELKDARIQVITGSKEVLDKLNQSSENLIGLYSSLDEVLKNDKLSTRLKNVANQYEETSKSVERNKKFFDMLSAIVPKSEEEAKQLEETLTEVSTAIIDGQTNMLKLNETFQEGRINFITEKFSQSVSILNGQLSMLENNIQLLNNGYQETASLMLNFKGIDSNYQTTETDKIVKEEQTRAEKIKKIKETTIENEVEMEVAKYEKLKEEEVLDLKNKMTLAVQGLKLSSTVTTEYMKIINDSFTTSNEEIASSIGGIWDRMLEKIRIVADEIADLSNKMQGKKSSKGTIIKSSNKPVQIWDSEGNAHFGYMDGGKTYTADGSRLPEGWTVKTPEGKFWKMGKDEKGISVKGAPKVTSTTTKTPEINYEDLKIDEAALATVTGKKLDTSKLDTIDSLSFETNLSAATMKKIEDFKAKRIQTDNIVKQAQETILMANKLGISSVEETTKLSDFIMSKINEDQLFLYDIEMEVAKNKLNLAKTAVVEIEKQYNDAVANGTVTENLKNEIYNARLLVSEQLIALDELTIKKNQQQVAIQNEIYSKMQQKIDLVQAEYDLSVELSGKLSDQSLLKSKESLKNQNEKFRAQQEYNDRLKAELKLIAVGTTEWNLKSEQIKENEIAIVQERQKLLSLTKEIKQNEIEAQLATFEKQMLNGKTIAEVREEKQKYIEGREKELEVENILNEVAREGLSLSAEQYDILKNKEKIRRSDLEAIQKEIDLQKQQIALDELRKNKTIQSLVKDRFGNWQYEYVADQEAIDAAEKSLGEAEVDYENWKSEQSLTNIETYINDIRQIMEKAFDGEFGTFVQIENALRNLESVGSSNSVTESIIVKLGDYMNGINQIIEDLGGFNLPTVQTNSNISNSQIENITQITISEVTFPSATDQNQIQSAILGLAELAKQKTQGN